MGENPSNLDSFIENAGEERREERIRGKSGKGEEVTGREIKMNGSLLVGPWQLKQDSTVDNGLLEKGPRIVSTKWRLDGR